MSTPLITQRLTLRKPNAADLPGWNQFFLSDRARFIGGGPEQDAGRSWRGFASIIGHWDIHGFGSFTFCDRASGKSLGLVGPWFPALWPEREIGWSVWDAADEGLGYAHEAAKAALTHVFKDLGWDTAVSYIRKGNSRSITLAERLGAKQDMGASAPDADDLVYRHDKALFA